MSIPERNQNSMRKDRSNLLLHEQNMYKSFIILALPVFGANMLKSFHDLVDTYFIGQLSNSVAAQAGISIAWPMINMMIAFNTGLAVAGVAVISQLLGNKSKEEAHRYAGLLVALSVTLGLLINLLLFIFSPAVMRMLGAEGEVLACASLYSRIRAFEMVFTFIFAAFQAIRQAQGDTVTPVILNVTALVINIILTAYFVKGLNMGLAGAALATVIGQMVIVPVCLYLLFSKKEALCLSLSDFRFDTYRIKRLVGIALPSAGSQALASLGFLVLQGVVLSYGAEVAAAFSIGNKITNLLLMPVIALGSILSAYVGQNIGAGNKERAKKSYIVSRNLGLIISVIGISILFPLRRWALGLLTNDAKTLSIAMEYIVWVLLTQPLMAMFQNYQGLFNGSGNTRYSLYQATVRLWVIRLPLIVFFKNCTNIGYSSIWYAMMISNILITFYGKWLAGKITYEVKVKAKKE